MIKDFLWKVLKGAPSAPDLAIAGLLLATIAMMILPIPVIVVDVFIGINFGIAILLLMVGVYLKTPVEFTAFPGIILISTIFRLSLSITTTRLILAEGDAGEFIRTFGEFVISGNVVVGLVVFLIITVVQFIVVAKGAERVAEVGARFTLDALPGKQMSIDAEMRNGDIDQAEAKRRRQALESESQLYGAMDGAMKFVKGDAIAGLIIIVINLIGGIGVGVLQRGLPIGIAVREYSLLTIGDALISQIPALFLSITAAIVVTRVSGGDVKQNLGRDIIAQVASERMAIRLAAAVLFGMSLIPGFPTAVLVVLGAAFAGASFLGRRPALAPEKSAAQASRASGAGTKAGARAGDRPAGDAETADAGDDGGAMADAALAIILSADVAERVSIEAVQEHASRVLALISKESGVSLPPVQAMAEVGATGSYRLEIEGVPMVSGAVRAGHVVLKDDPVHAELLGVPFETVQGSLNGVDAVWVGEEHVPRLAEAGIAHASAAAFVAEQFGIMLRRNMSGFVGIQETKAMLAALEPTHGDLVREVARIIPLQRIADVFRRLLDEEVSLRNMRLVLEALVEWSEREHNPILLAEYVRSSLRRQISFQYATPQRSLAAILIERDIEDIVRASLKDTAVGTYVVLDDSTALLIVEQVKARIAPMQHDRVKPVLLTSLDIRRHLRSLLIRNAVWIAVMSYQELSPEFSVQPIGSISLDVMSDQLDSFQEDLAAAE